MRKRFIIPFIFFVISVVIIDACSYSNRATKRLLKASASTQFDMVIVPGVPFEHFTWSRTMKGRVYWAKYLYDKGIAKNLMFSGSSVATPYYEATIMALYAEAIGIPREHIFTETRAEHSTENIYYSYRKAKKLGFHKIAIASDPFQTKLLGRFTRKKVSPDIALLPFVIDTMRVLEATMTNPTIDYKQAFNKDFVVLNKREGFWKRLRGTRGLNMDTAAYR